MSLLGFEQALSDLVISPDFCVDVTRDPLAALARYDLSRFEQQRLTTLARDPGLGVGTMLHQGRRLTALYNALPQTCALLGGPALKEIVNQYWRSNPFKSIYYEQEAMSFGTFALQALQDGKIDNPYLEDILNFDLAALALSRAAQSDNPIVAALAFDETSTPTLNPLYRVVPFHHDPELLLSTVPNVPTDPPIPTGTCYLLLHQIPNERLQLKQISAQMGQLLAACNNRTTVAQLCQQFSLTVPDLHSLAALLTFTPHTPPQTHS